MMRKQLCRNFQRGSCQYGARCKFLHQTPQQQPQQRTNPFGFGAQSGFQQQQQQQQRQNANPFGFGVKSNSQLGAAADSGPRREQSKPNQWVRTPAAPSSRPADNQAQLTNHTCTDPEACKCLIVEDFQNERPMWKLTCYGHWKNLPCDIMGDISYEELRAAAYDDARRGLSMQAIIERERSLLNSKLAEFDNLRRNPYIPRSNSSSGQNSFPSAMSNAFTSNSSPPVVSTFSQAASLSGVVGSRPSPPAVAAFGNHSPFQTVGSTNPFSNPSTTPSFFGANNLQLGSIGPNSSQFPTQMQVNSVSTGSQGPSAFGSLSNIFPAATTSPQALNLANNQSTSSFSQITTEVQLPISTRSEINSGDASVWLRDKWNPGEIPEEAPPDAFV